MRAYIIVRCKLTILFTHSFSLQESIILSIFFESGDSLARTVWVAAFFSSLNPDYSFLLIEYIGYDDDD